MHAIRLAVEVSVPHPTNRKEGPFTLIDWHSRYRTAHPTNRKDGGARVANHSYGS